MDLIPALGTNGRVGSRPGLELDPGFDCQHGGNDENGIGGNRGIKNMFRGRKRDEESDVEKGNGIERERERGSGIEERREGGEWYDESRVKNVESPPKILLQSLKKQQIKQQQQSKIQSKLNERRMELERELENELNEQQKRREKGLQHSNVFSSSSCLANTAINSTRVSH